MVGTIQSTRKPAVQPGLFQSMASCMNRTFVVQMKAFQRNKPQSTIKQIRQPFFIEPAAGRAKLRKLLPFPSRIRIGRPAKHSRKRWPLLPYNGVRKMPVRKRKEHTSATGRQRSYRPAKPCSPSAHRRPSSAVPLPCRQKSSPPATAPIQRGRPHRRNKNLFHQTAGRNVYQTPFSYHQANTSGHQKGDSADQQDRT